MPLVEDFAAALLEVFEGCKLKAYQDSGGVWTIGIGHTGSDVYEGLTITQEQAQIFLLKDQQSLFKLVDAFNFSNPAKAAYISFGYNCGQTKLQNVLRGTDDIRKSVHCTDRHGNVIPGLLARRRLEYLLTQL
jgi:GH24 family phage-related lysozyme (muramidase)